MALTPQDITVIVDTREQLPLDLVLPSGEKLQTIRQGLPTGDYSVKGIENEVAIERKSLPDFVKCVTIDRDRFIRELHRLRSYRTRAVVLEASWDHIELHTYRGQTDPQAIIGSILSWSTEGVPIILAGDRIKAAEFVARILWGAARRRFAELTELSSSRKPRNSGNKAS